MPVHGKLTVALDKEKEFHYNILAIGVWRSLVSRLVRVQEASGSNPDTPTKNVGIAFAIPTFFSCMNQFTFRTRRCNCRAERYASCRQ